LKPHPLAPVPTSASARLSRPTNAACVRSDDAALADGPEFFGKTAAVLSVKHTF